MTVGVVPATALLLKGCIHDPWFMGLAVLGKPGRDPHALEASLDLLSVCSVMSSMVLGSPLRDTMDCCCSPLPLAAPDERLDMNVNVPIASCMALVVFGS